MEKEGAQLVVKIDTLGESPNLCQVKTVLLDALYEFAAARRPASEYVKEHYPNGYCGDHTMDEWKINEVHERTSVAKLLHDGLIAVTLGKEKD